MIEIRNGRIYFYHKYKRTVQAQDFQCISAYVCPECKNVLLAYFVGYIKELKDYAEDEKKMHAYEMGNCNGGQWISLLEYQHKSMCRWEYATVRGIKNGVDEYLKRYNNKHYTQRKPLELMDNKTIDKQPLINAIEKGIPGFKLIHDEIGMDAPLLMFNKNQIVDGASLKLSNNSKLY